MLLLFVVDIIHVVAVVTIWESLMLPFLTISEFADRGLLQ